LLVLDRDGDGLITSGRELFGQATVQADGTVAANGYLALADFDTNHDGFIDAKDAGFNDLQVWQDANQDGVTQAGELHSLTSLGVVSLDLHASQTSADQNGNWIGLDSTYTTTDGATHAMADVWFAISKDLPVAPDPLTAPTADSPVTDVVSVAAATTVIADATTGTTDVTLQTDASPVIPDSTTVVETQPVDVATSQTADSSLIDASSGSTVTAATEPADVAAGPSDVTSNTEPVQVAAAEQALEPESPSVDTAAVQATETAAVDTSSSATSLDTAIDTVAVVPVAIVEDMAAPVQMDLVVNDLSSNADFIQLMIQDSTTTAVSPVDQPISTVDTASLDAEALRLLTEAQLQQQALAGVPPPDPTS
jgi:hypothetical protein